MYSELKNVEIPLVKTLEKLGWEYASSSELDSISKELSSAMGETIKFDYKFDRDLIGGLKLQLRSIMIDTSIRNKLKKYEQIMLEN